MKPPVFSIELSSFASNPYPALAEMRASSPICYVPELDAVLVTRRDDIFRFEKNIEVFSSVQPGGLMTTLMGENMMRKDGDAHMFERKQINKSVSPKTVQDTWRAYFEIDTEAVLNSLEMQDKCDIVTAFAMPVSANALRRVTGLNNMTPQQLDDASQGMIDGIANYHGDVEIEKHCQRMTAMIDQCIDEMLPTLEARADKSLLSVLTRAGQPMDSVRANIKLAISGGQNEPRYAIAGCVWALLKHPDQLNAILAGEHAWRDAFEEYSRWISPIGMSPRRIARDYEWDGIEFKEGQRAFLMFGSANRDESIFDEPDEFRVGRNAAKAVTFGAGPHFCAGAWVSRTLIADVALPGLFERFPRMRLDGDVEFGGWAFRGVSGLEVSLKQ